MPDLAGSLGGGGRYDGLIGMFSGENVPACGFSLGLERILVVMAERKMFPAEVAEGVGGRDRRDLRRVDRAGGDGAGCGTPRRAGMRAELYPEPDKLGKQMKYAAWKRIRSPRSWVVTNSRAAKSRSRTWRPANRSACARQDVRAASRCDSRILQARPADTIMNIVALGTLARTHTAGELTAADVGRDAVLLGWVHRVRDLGALLFVDLRDRHGMTQVVVDAEPLLSEVKSLRSEFVIAAIGRVQARRSDAVNPKMATGEIEVAASEIRLLNDAKLPPFGIADEMPVNEDMRLKYRYLDLRKPRMQRNIALRHRATMAIRKYFDEEGFLEIETPMLTKSTPEGARDYLVPSRVHPGEFYALPQSPQIFKQILMISGMDRYFQIVKCFRDEDLRADRQPEFTQVDVEISFATEDLVFSILEPLMERLMALIGRDAPHPFRRMPYAEAIATYGSDKPDLRPGMEIRDLSPAFADSPFSVFRNAICGGWRRAGVSRSRRRRSTRAANSTNWWSRRSSSAHRAWSGRARPKGPCRVRR